MSAGQVFAVCAELLPDKRDRVQADHFHALVCKEEHFFCHAIEHRRVGVIQVPLVAVERRPGPAALFEQIREERERARVFIGEDFAQILLVGIGHLPVWKDTIELQVFLIAGFGAFGPEVLIGCVVEHEIHNQADAGGTKITCQRGELFHGAKRRMHFAIAAHRIAAIVLAFRCLEQWHQVQIGQPQLFEIGDLGSDALEIASKEVHITDAAQHPVGLEPQRIGLTVSIECTQVVGSLEPGTGQAAKQILEVKEEIVTRLVQAVIEIEQGREIRVQPLRENLPARRVCVDRSGQFLLQARQEAFQGAPCISFVLRCIKSCGGLNCHVVLTRGKNTAPVTERTCIMYGAAEQIHVNALVAGR